MLRVIKNKRTTVKAYQLGSNHEVIKKLMKQGKIRDLGEGRFAVYSQEAINGKEGGEIGVAGDWIKVDGSGCPYPNDKEFFEANHRQIEEDTFEQVPRILYAWNKKCEMCPEIRFLIETKGLKINEKSFEQYYSAKLWGTTEAAAADAMIVFYDIQYKEDGSVKDATFNFVARDAFEKAHSFA